LEGRLHGVFYFVHELHSLGYVDQNVGSGVFGSISPDFEGFRLVPFVFFGKNFGSFLYVVLGGYSFSSLFDSVGEFESEGGPGTVKSVVFIGGFGHADN
jgi:hypothetical protein